MELPEGAVSYGRRVAQLAEEHPDHVALVFAAADGHDETFTSRELETRAVAAARVLAAAGVDERSRVAIALPNSPEHVIAALGAWKLGACVVPVRADLPQWERERVLDVAAPRVVVADELGERPVVHREEIADAPPDAAGTDLPDRVPQPAMAVTSGGATGSPKLIVTPAPGAAVPGAAFATSASAFPGGAGHVNLVPGPLYHTNGFAICHSGLFEDQRVVLMESFDAARVVDLVERWRVTLMTMAPTMLLRVARLPGIDDRDLSSIQGIMQGAASCPQWLLRRWITLVGAERVFVAYGSTERVGLTMVRGDEWLVHPGTVGRGVATEIRILDRDGRDLERGEVGEIFLRSEASRVAPTYEYVGADPAPRTADGFTSIGDLGWLDADGYLFIADRRVDMIVTGGANVFPAEVEAAVSELDGIGDVAVIGVPDDEWGRRVVALVEAVAGRAAPSVDDLDAHCRARLAPYKVPREFVIVERLPRTPAGKLNRAALTEEFARR